MVVFETDSVHLALVFDRGIGIVQPDEVQGGIDKVSCACISEKLEPESVFLIGGTGWFVEPNVVFRQKCFSVDSGLVNLSARSRLMSLKR